MPETLGNPDEMLRRIGLYTGPPPSPGQTLHVSLHTGTPNPTPLTSRAFEAGETVLMESEISVIKGSPAAHQGYLSIPVKLQKKPRYTTTCLSCGVLVGDTAIHTPVCPGVLREP